MSDTILTAAQARDNTQAYYNNRIENEFNSIIDCINGAIEKGEFYISTDKQIEPVVKERLETLGYKIKAEGKSYDQEFIVSW